MLELVNITHQIKRPKGDALTVLEGIHLIAPTGHLLALVGPTESGKSTLLQVLAGLVKPFHGTMVWHGRDLNRRPPHPNEVGFVPHADDVLHDLLTVQENIISAFLLRIHEGGKDAAISRAAHLMALTGLETLAGKRASTLNRAQRRRLKLAVALVSDPLLVICDEFTDGIDARSERELSALLQVVARDIPRRLVINATQSVSGLAAYDTVALLHEGRICYHGPQRALVHYFSISNIEELYPRLAKRPAQRWGDSWARHRDSYYDAFKLGRDTDSLETSAEDDENDPANNRTAATADESGEPAEAAIASKASAEPPKVEALPGFMSQVQHLFRRRWTIFRRRRKEWIQHLLLLVLGPLAVTLAVWPNLHHLKKAATDAAASPDSLYPAAYTASMAVLLQVLFLIFAGVRNGAREIAGERALFERERVSGVGAGAYLTSKLAFLFPLLIGQSVTMGLTVDVLTGELPGHALFRLILLILTSAAFTLICLGISALSRAAERAHSYALTLAIAQIPLAGALLGWPRVLGGVIQPFVTAYHGWSGSVDSMHALALFKPLTAMVNTWFATPPQAMTALAIHAGIGVALAVVGLRRRRL